jgi:integrase/recombinase XerD
MAKPYKNEKGIWCQRFTTPVNSANRKVRIHVQCTAEYNTPTYLRELVRAAIERHMKGLFTTGDTFESYVRDKFMLQYPAANNLQKSSRELLTYLFEKIAFEEIGSKPMSSIGKSELATMMDTLQKKQRIMKGTGEVKRAYSDQTIRLTMIAVTSVFRWAFQVKDISVMPDIVIPKVAQAKKPKPYTPEEAMALIEAARNPNERLMFLLMFDAGLRKAEVLGFQLDQVNFTTHVLTVDRQLYRGFERPTKSGRARTVPMSAVLEDAIKAVVADRIRVKYVLVDEHGEPYNEYWVRWIFQRCRRSAGIAHKRVHDARHSYATLRTATGTDAFALQRLMGHADIRTTQGYVHPVEPQPPSILDPKKAVG